MVHVSLMYRCLVLGVLATVATARASPIPNRRPSCHDYPALPCEDMSASANSALYTFAENKTAANIENLCTAMLPFATCMGTNLELYIDRRTECGRPDSTFPIELDQQMRLFLAILFEMHSSICGSPSEEVADHLTCIIEDHNVNNCIMLSYEDSGLFNMAATRRQYIYQGLEAPDVTQDIVTGMMCTFLDSTASCLRGRVTEECSADTAHWISGFLDNVLAVTDTQLQCAGGDGLLDELEAELEDLLTQ